MIEKIYMAHPFPSREKMRAWELQFETETGIEVVNPFYDLERHDVRAIDEGLKARYDLDYETLVDRDLQAIQGVDAVLAIVDGNVSIGTIMEIVYAYQYNKPVIVMCSNGHEEHPWLKYHAEIICTSLDAFKEAWLAFQIGQHDEVSL